MILETILLNIKEILVHNKITNKIDKLIFLTYQFENSLKHHK
jgi:hypothetical protein